MTVIAALVTPGGVWLAADSQASNGADRVSGITKLLRLRVGPHEVLIATAGRKALSQLVQHDLVIPPLPSERTDSSLDMWAYRLSVEMCRLATEAKPPIVDDDGAVDGYAILAFAGRLWLIGELNATRVVNGYQSIGSGEAYALGAFETLAALGVLLDDPERSVRTACAAAIAWDTNCGGPVAVEHVR